MEHSPYAQSPSPSSSLVNFPAPTNLPDIRLHRPFSQMHDLKHLHLPFQGANFGFRFMENYSALPAHLLHHLQPPFLHPALDPRISFSQAGVFQPLGSPNPHHQHPHHAAAAGLKGFASAFAPPAKCYKIDDGNKPASHAEGVAQQQQQPPPGSQQQQHMHQQQQHCGQQQPAAAAAPPPPFPYPPRRSPCSPASASASPPSSSAAANAHQHARDECSDRDTPSSGAVSEDGRTIRRKKPSPPASTRAPTPANGAAAVNHQHHHNNNNNNNNNNNGSIKQQQQQHSLQQSSGGPPPSQQPAAATGCCPVCGAALRTAHELESHFVWELERLYKQAAAAGRRHRRATPDKPSAEGHLHPHHHGAGLGACARDGGGRLSPAQPGCGRDGSLHGRWETYQKVKANRHNRLRIKNRKRKPDEILLTPTACCCPVCNEPVAAATQEQMNAHVEMCLRNKGHPSAVAVTAVGNDDEDENVDVEGDAETTMYDMVYTGGGWPQQHNRMRQQPMVLHGGGYNRGTVPASGPPRQPTAGEDPAEDAVLVVDDAEAYNKYGPNQYADRDVIVPSRPATASSEGRRLTPAEQNDPNAMETADSCDNVGPLDVSIKKENALQEDGGAGAVKPKMDVDKFCGQFSNNGQVVEALKARIRELELASKTGGDKFTCLLCKGHFKDPVVSTSCWHVYCEVCWLQILGAKKLCPQCYVITLPSHLRRVYL